MTSWKTDLAEKLNHYQASSLGVHPGSVLYLCRAISIPIIPKNYWTLELFKLNSWLIQLRIYKTCNIYIHLGNDMKRPIYFHKQWFSSISPLLCCHHWSLFRLFQRQIAGSLWGARWGDFTPKSSGVKNSRQGISWIFVTPAQRKLSPNVRSPISEISWNITEIHTKHTQRCST